MKSRRRGAGSAADAGLRGGHKAPSGLTGERLNAGIHQRVDSASPPWCGFTRASFAPSAP
jgi:hypothetical protein